jgi:hypothetical protein
LRNGERKWHSCEEGGGFLTRLKLERRKRMSKKVKEFVILKSVCLPF